MYVLRYSEQHTQLVSQLCIRTSIKEQEEERMYSYIHETFEQPVGRQNCSGLLSAVTVKRHSALTSLGQLPEQVSNSFFLPSSAVIQSLHERTAHKKAIARFKSIAHRHSYITELELSPLLTHMHHTHTHTHTLTHAPQTCTYTPALDNHGEQFTVAVELHLHSTVWAGAWERRLGSIIMNTINNETTYIVCTANTI